jgi:uncharacterized protein (DUF305 family)
MDNKSQNQAILFGVGGLVIGVLLAGYAANNNNSSMMNMMGMGRAHNMMNDDGTMGMLQGKSGDAFDKAFIEMMIPHHEGAIDMAEAAKQSANHTEIKTLADAIISSQSKEINDMKTWYKSWYGVEAPTHNSMMH